MHRNEGPCGGAGEPRENNGVPIVYLRLHSSDARPRGHPHKNEIIHSLYYMKPYDCNLLAQRDGLKTTELPS